MAKRSTNVVGVQRSKRSQLGRSKKVTEVGFVMGPKDRRSFKEEMKGWGHSRR